jgi:hypothetical protein
MGVPFWTSAGLVLGTIFLGLGMEERMRPANVPLQATEPVAG